MMMKTNSNNQSTLNASNDNNRIRSSNLSSRSNSHEANANRNVPTNTNTDTAAEHAPGTKSVVDYLEKELEKMVKELDTANQRIEAERELHVLESADSITKIGVYEKKNTAKNKNDTIPLCIYILLH